MNENRYFQFLAGERKGEILVFDKIVEEDGVIFVCFKDNSRMNEVFILPINQNDATGKIMAEIESPNNAWGFKDEWVGREEEVWETNADGERVCVQPLIEGRKVVKLFPPRNSTTKFGYLPPPENKQTPEIAKKQINNTDPVYITLEKAKKVQTEIDMVLTISLPPKNLYKVMKESFDDGDKKVIEYIIDNIDVEYLKQMIGQAVLNMYDQEVETSIIM